MLIFDKINIFLFFLLGTLIHELGHILSCLLCGKKPVIQLSLFGIKLCNYPNDKLKKMVVLLCGPLLNLIIMVVLYICIQNRFTLNRYIFLCANTVIFAFNMLPFDFLDGGQILCMFISNDKLVCIFNIISLIVLLCFVVYFSNNYIYSFFTIILFIIYYIKNKTNRY